jgi:hypothetical protein
LFGEIFAGHCGIFGGDNRIFLLATNYAYRRRLDTVFTGTESNYGHSLSPALEFFAHRALAITMRPH